ncbi:MAG: hypothetical protein WC343_08975 [Bacilli bacterium]|jgi:hypothetical protein
MTEYEDNAIDTGDLDFNVEEDYVPELLLPSGTYFGNVIEVNLDPATAIITFKIALEGNEDRMLSDGQTPADGTHVYYKVWLPKKSDKGELTSNGKDKYQMKVNGLRKAQKDLGIDMNTVNEIMNAIENSTWIGLSGRVTTKLKKVNDDLYTDVRRFQVTKTIE